MLDILLFVLKSALVALAISPVVIGIGLGLFEGSMRPRLIPRTEIERLADDLMRRYPADPEHAAFLKEHAAWFESESYERGKWHRVRKLIRKRLR